jgi:hypothetical protein
MPANKMIAPETTQLVKTEVDLRLPLMYPPLAVTVIVHLVLVFLGDPVVSTPAGSPVETSTIPTD